MTVSPPARRGAIEDSAKGYHNLEFDEPGFLEVRLTLHVEGILMPPCIFHS